MPGPSQEPKPSGQALRPVPAPIPAPRRPCTCREHAGERHRQEGADLARFVAALAVQRRAALEVHKQQGPHRGRARGAAEHRREVLALEAQQLVCQVSADALGVPQHQLQPVAGAHLRGGCRGQGWVSQGEQGPREGSGGGGTRAGRAGTPALGGDDVPGPGRRRIWLQRSRQSLSASSSGSHRARCLCRPPARRAQSRPTPCRRSAPRCGGGGWGEGYQGQRLPSQGLVCATRLQARRLEAVPVRTQSSPPLLQPSPQPPLPPQATHSSLSVSSPSPPLPIAPSSIRSHSASSGGTSSSSPGALGGAAGSTRE
jgi:hypothetical protein